MLHDSESDSEPRLIVRVRVPDPHETVQADQSFKLVADQNFYFLTKISIFDQNFDFWPKFRFLIKILIFDQIFDFRLEFLFLTKISIFDQNFDFWPNFWF